MAKGKYEQLYNNLFKGDNRKSVKTVKTDVEKVQNQIDNAKTKITKADIDVDKAVDTRNPIEKMLNLTPDQNVLFDIFELIGRPQQALFSGWENAQKGKDFWEGAGEGFSGKKETQFKEILKNANIGGGDREGKLDLVDVLGFIGDVALDPADLSLIPVSGGANVAAKAAKGADTAADAAKAGKTVRKSLTSLAFDGIGKGIKGSAKMVDKGVEGALKAMDNKGVRNSIGEVAKITYKNPLAKTAKGLGKQVSNAHEIAKEIPYGKLESYKELKEWFTQSFNSMKSMPKKALESFRKGNAKHVDAMNKAYALRNSRFSEITKIAQKQAKVLGDVSPKNVEKIAGELDEAFAAYKEYTKLGRTGFVSEALEAAKDGVLKHEDGIVKVLEDLATDINKAERGLRLTIGIDDIGNVKLSDDWKKIGKKGYEGLGFDKEKLHQIVDLPKNYRPEQIEYLEGLVKEFNENPLYIELDKKLSPIFDEANAILDDVWDIGLSTTYIDNDGYVRHAFDKEKSENFKRLGIFNSDGTFIGKGDTRVLGERKYKMSAMEANNMFEDTIMKNFDNLSKEAQEYVTKNKTLFHTTYTASFDDYLMNVPKVARDNELLNEILVKQTFGDWGESQKTKRALKKAKKAGDTKLVEELSAKYASEIDNVNMKVLTKKDSSVPMGFRVLESKEKEKLIRKIDTLGQELGVDSLKDVSKVIKNGKKPVAINNDILRLIGVDIKKESKAITRMYDKALGFFKRNKVLSPTFQMNNLSGNMSNMALGGIGVTKQARLMPQAAEIMKEAPDLMRKTAEGVELTAKEAKKLGIWKAFTEAGFGDASMSLNLRDMPESLQKYFSTGRTPQGVKELILDGLPYWNNVANNHMDNMARLATFIEGSNNPKFLQNLGVENAADAVRKVLFDPSEISQFEQDVMKRIIPFYTFTKKNLAYHIQNLGKNGQRYNRLVKGVKGLGNLATDGNYDNMADFLKENMYIPVPGLGENGVYKILRTSLPFGQLVDLISDPIGAAASTTVPMMGLMTELATNKQAFNRSDIEKFPGEKSKNIPILTKKQEYLLSQLTGLDVPLKQVSRFAEGFAGGEESKGGLMGGLDSVTAMTQNVETDKLFKLKDELDHLNTVMKQYEQKGVEFSTMNELKKANSNLQMNKLMSKLRKYSDVKKNPYK